MSGILEQIQQRQDQQQQQIDAILAHLRGGAVQQQQQPVQQQQPAPQQQFTQTAQNTGATLGGGLGGLGGFTPQQPAQPQFRQNVTADEIMALIAGPVENPQIKEALGGEMRAMGINALGETKPEQYGELYYRFEQVLQRFQQQQQQTGAIQTGGVGLI